MRHRQDHRLDEPTPVGPYKLRDITLSLPSFKGSTLFPPVCARASPQTDYLIRLLKVAQNPPDHVPAHTWAGALQVGKRKLTRKRFDGRFNQRGLGSAGALDLAGPFLELAVRSFQDKED